MPQTPDEKALQDLIEALRELRRGLTYVLSPPFPEDYQPPGWQVKRHKNTSFAHKPTGSYLEQYKRTSLAYLVDEWERSREQERPGVMGRLLAKARGLPGFIEDAIEELLDALEPGRRVISNSFSSLDPPLLAKLCDLRDGLDRYARVLGGVGRILAGDRDGALQLRTDIDSILSQLDPFAPDAPRPSRPTADYCLLPGHRVRWDEETKIAPILWQLLFLILRTGGRDVDFRKVDEALYSEEEADDTRIQKRVSELNPVLEAIHFPWTFRTETTMVDDQTRGKIIYVQELRG